MKFRVKDLFNQPAQLHVTGTEEWLSDIYSSFTVSDASGASKPPGQLQASLTFAKDIAGFVRVTGQVAFNPFLDCSRCSENIPWPINEEFDVTYSPAPTETVPGREVNLSKDELDQYVIEDGTIDIEQLLNDMIHLAIPINTVKLTEDESACSICGLDVTEDRVYGEGSSEKESPFAILKKLTP